MFSLAKLLHTLKLMVGCTWNKTDPIKYTNAFEYS